MSAPPPLSTLLPSSLREWRSSGFQPEGTYPRSIWDPLEEFFREQGLLLWKAGWEHCVLPPNDHPRCPDPFAYRTIYNDNKPTRVPRFDLVKAIHCPARTTDDRDVLIRLVVKGDEGLNHLMALRKLAMGHAASRGDNHIVPVLRQIILDDMVFVVFPLMNEGFDRPWYHQFHEIIDAVVQVLEGVAFCHERLVAHLDIDSDNILINFVGGPTRTDPMKRDPFRAYFPVRYYLNDFELAVCFDEQSELATRRVAGLPIKGLRGAYGRDVAPEMSSDEPYCPFKTDVWQLGNLFLGCFKHLDLPAEMMGLFIEMSSDDPLSRPAASEALQRLRPLRMKLSNELLVSTPPKPPFSPPLLELPN